MRSNLRQPLLRRRAEQFEKLRLSERIDQVAAALLRQLLEVLLAGLLARSAG